MKNNTIAEYQSDIFSGKDKNICPVNTTIGILSGKWKMEILWQLQTGVKRFGELKTAINNITSTVLSHQLNVLIREGIITKHIYAEVPPRVEYSLTETGRSLVKLIIAMEAWGLTYLGKLVPEYRPNCLWNI